MSRTEYGVRRYGGYVEACIATRRIEELVGEKNVWLVSRTVTEWQHSEDNVPCRS